MTRLEFMKQLESLLLDIPLEERVEALQYYSDYFEDAGEDHEEEIIIELGSPERIVSIIKADLNANSSDRENSGCFTEKGYEDTLYQEDRFEIVGTSTESGEDKTKRTYYSNHTEQRNNNGQERNNNNETGSFNAGNGEEHKSNNTSNKGLIVILCIIGGFIALPVLLPLTLSIIGIAIGLLAALFGLIFGLGLAGIVMIGAGVVLFITGLIKIAIPFAGIALCGGGLLIFGIGMLFTLFTGFLCRTVVPAVIRGIVYLFRLPFKNRSVMA